MEADIRRFYPGTVPDDLSLPRLAWLVRHLPSEAVLSGNEGWSVSDFLAADSWTAWTGKPHPADPRLKQAESAQADRLSEARARSEARRLELGITGSVLRREVA